MKNTHLVYVDGFGVYINSLFAERHKIEVGADIHPSVLDRHRKDVPVMDSDTHHVWREEKSNETRFGINNVVLQKTLRNRYLQKESAKYLF